VAARAAATGSTSTGTTAGASAATGSAATAGKAATAGRAATATKTAASGPASGGAWSDGSPTEEAPYDPEYDGPARPDGAAWEGFDPGDEPLDDVIDEKTARQSSEQQAVQLLREAFGAEKISES
jgi:DNA polymerase-3 subunit gamma/tau